MLSFQRSSFLLVLTLSVFGRSSVATRYANEWSIVVSDHLTPSHVEAMAQRHGLRNRGQVTATRAPAQAICDWIYGQQDLNRSSCLIDLL